MSYRAGMSFGPTQTEPRIICDGCGAERVIRGLPPAWFLDRKAPPGWRALRMADGSRRWDLCKACWAESPTSDGS
jgi:hypothetical protein